MGKFNEGKKIFREDYQRSSIWKYLHEDIDAILATDLDEKRQKIAYISYKSIEQILSTLLKYSKEHRYYMLSGLTGIGKTTIMRHVFFADKNTSTPIIRNRNLIIPIDFDSFVEPRYNNDYQDIFEDMYIKVFSQAAVTVKDKFNLPDITDKDFVDFFTANHTGIINYIDESGNLNTYSNMKSEVYKNKNSKLYAYIANLCIFLNHQNSNIRNVILVVDNIESLGIYKTPVEVPLAIAHKAINFMCNKSVIKGRKPKWVPNILICCRHYIYRMMHSRDFDDGSLSQIFESYSKPVYIDLDVPVQLSKIIEKRFEAYIKSKKNKNKKWQTSMNVVHDMLFKIIDETNINDNFDNMILNFNLSDIRCSLKTIKDIVYNKPWIQRDDFEDNGSFVISNLSDFNCKLSNILRAIGMKSGYIYNPEDNLIPNLLSNSPNNKSNIYDLIALKYFMGMASAWRTPLKVSDFYVTIDSIFQNSINDIKNQFVEAIWHLLKDRMLLRSADQEQRDISSITIQTFNSIDYVYVSNAAKDYWMLLGENSTILEMLMDDIYIDETKCHTRSKKQTKYRMFNRESFLVALEYLFILFVDEKEIIKISFDNKKEKEYIKYFGTDLVSEHLLNGLERSFESYFKKTENEYTIECNKKINHLREMINKLKNKME